MKMKFEVNKPLVPMKAHYFLWNAGTGPVVPFLSIYARQLGFSSVIVGLIYTILPISGMIAKPVFGALADRFRCQKIFFLFAQLLTAAAFLAIFYSPKIPNDIVVDFMCANGNAAFRNPAWKTLNPRLVEKLQNKQISTSCQLTCQMSTENLQVLCAKGLGAKYCDNATIDSARAVTFSALVPLGKLVLFENVTNGKNTTRGIMEFRAANLSDDAGALEATCSGSGLRSICNVGCSDNDVNALLLRDGISDADAYATYQFWVFLLLMITAWVGQAISVSIGDAICFEMLGDKPNRYGSQRMYGALGWGLLSLITGVLVDALSRDKSYNDYTVAFYLAAGFLVLDFFVSSTLKYKQTKLSTNILKDVGKLLLNVRIVVFLAWCICVGMCTGLMWQFLLWLVEDLAKARGETDIQTLQGVIMGVQCLGGELPFFFLSGKILKKIGHISAMSLVMFVFGLRLVTYSLIDNPWYFIPVELSSGLTFGLFYACMASYASIVAPAGTEATMQGLVGAVFEGVGVSLGSFLAGLAMSKVSGSLTFRYFGFGILAACGIHIIVQFLLKRKDASPVADRKYSFEKVRLDDQQELTSVKSVILR